MTQLNERGKCPLLLLNDGIWVLEVFECIEVAGVLFSSGETKQEASQPIRHGNWIQHGKLKAQYGFLSKYLIVKFTS